MKIKTRPLVTREDARGRLVNVFPEGTKEIKHVFYATLKSGQVRGNHYHKHAVEWIGVVRGSVTIMLTDVFTGEKAETIITAKEPTLVEIPINQEVKVLNHTDQEAAFVGLVDDVFDPDNRDVFVL